MVIPLFKVFMAPNVGDYILPVLHSGYIGEGPKVKEFEQKFGQFIENPNVVATNSGTSAIVMALILAGVGHGDYVLSTPMTCLATNMAILSLGARIIWCDIGTDGNIDISTIPDVTGRHIKAIVCVDWGGNPCDFTALISKAREWNVPLIEDACQALGATYNSTKVGNQADYVCFSTQAIKTLTTGDGGFLVVNTGNDNLEKARLLKWFGLNRTTSTSMRCNQDPPVLGYKFQMNDIAASIGLANLDFLKDNLNWIRAHARKYNDCLSNLAHVKIVTPNPSSNPSYWLYTVFVENVDHFITYMASKGIECSPAHRRNDNKTIFSPFQNGLLPGVDFFDIHHVCIPCGWWMSHETSDYIVSTVRSYTPWT